MGTTLNPSDLPLRWNQLTALCLMAWGGNGAPQTCPVILAILSRCHKLQSCKLRVHGPPEAHFAESIVECPSLHTLDLLCAGSPLYTAGRLLNYLSLPDLRDFKLSGRRPEFSNTFTADRLVSSLTTSTHLERISIESHTFSKLFLTDFLRGLPPTVLRLQITEPKWMQRTLLAHAPLDDDVLAALDATPDRPTPCPALQELVIQYCHKVSDEALLRFVLSREPTLRLVDINFVRERQVDILPSLKSFAEAGGKTSITYITLPPPQFSPWLGLPDAQPEMPTPQGAS